MEAMIALQGGELLAGEHGSVPGSGRWTTRPRDGPVSSAPVTPGPGT